MQHETYGKYGVKVGVWAATTANKFMHTDADQGVIKVSSILVIVLLLVSKYVIFKVIIPLYSLPQIYSHIFNDIFL